MGKGTSSRIMGNIKMYKSKALVIILFIVSITASVHAQTSDASESSSQSGKSEGQVADGSKLLKGGSATAAEQYQSSLNDLAASYDEGLKRLTDQNAKIKELFDKGLVSRRDVEQSDNSVAEARAKVEDVRREIASAKAKLADASMINQQVVGSLPSDQ